MHRQLEAILLDADLDLTLSTIDRTDPQQFRVVSRPGRVRIFFSILFVIPCFLLLQFGIKEGGYALLLPIAFCPALAFLGIIFGLTIQEKTFYPSARIARKSARILFWFHDVTITLPAQGAIKLSRQSSAGETLCSYYRVHVEAMNGFGFTIARDEKRRDAFAQELAHFLGYAICNTEPNRAAGYQE